MSVTGLGTTRKGSRLPVLPILSAGFLIASLILFAVELGRFAQGRDLIQTDISVAGVPVTGLRLNEAAGRWEKVFQLPVELDYGEYPILLNPADIGFRPNSDLMLADLQSKITGTNNYWADFWNYLWRRPTSPVEVPLIANYQDAKLREVLQDISDRYEQDTNTARFSLDTMTFGAGAARLRLDIDTSLKLVDDALRRPTNRKVKLAMKGEGASGPDMQTLKQAILDYLNAVGVVPDGHAYLASIGVIDLQTGREMWINPNVAYSAMSTIKIPVMLNIFRKLNFDPDDDTKWLMGASILCSSNSASNYLIQLSGTGATPKDQLASGLQQVINTAATLGATNTYISAPLYVGDKNYQFSIPAPQTSPDKTYDAKADTFSQTTAQDMAALMQNLYMCSEYGSGLIAAIPDAYTKNECKEMVELLSGNVIGRLIELGVPPGTRIAHKNGWGGTQAGGANVSDVGIVYTPGGNYILSAYFWEAKANQDGIGTLKPWEAIEGVSRIVYNFFNADQPMLTPRQPENPYGAIDCVMPNPQFKERLSLTNINNGRFDANGYLVPDACFNYPQCGAHPDSGVGGGGAPTGDNSPATAVPTAAAGDSPPVPK